MSFQGTLLPSTVVAAGTAYTATVDGITDIRGAIFTINVSAITGATPSLVLTLEYYDQASASYISVATVATISTVSTISAIIYPGAAGAIYEVLPASYRLKYQASSGNTFTFSIGVNYLN